MLTRDFLLKADCRTAFGDIDETLLWTGEQREASLCETLARRPGRGPVWVFGYGSLMWNPAFEFDDARAGRLTGWHRAFCLRLTAGRGTACKPGRMLALREGGETVGMAFRIPENELDAELPLLWKREMITGCYLPTWCHIVLDDGREIDALVFIMDARHPLFEGDTRPEVIAPLIAGASGPLGTNAQYLFSLAQQCQKMGIVDESMERLNHLVQQLHQPGA